MSLSEFDIIRKYFTQKKLANSSIIAGVGDDSALVDVPAGHQLAVATDTLVSGAHFPETTSAYDIGYKALAVNISDMAAMGAKPLYATLAITLENNDEEWLKLFSEGFYSLAANFSIDLIGGDVTRGPLTVTVQILGIVPEGEALLRSGARPGENIYVTGKLGLSAYALFAMNNGNANINMECMKRLNRPEPRLKTGLLLRKIATSCIDISDGLGADLGHLLSASSVGAEIELDQIPFYEELNMLEPDMAYSLGLNTGDDYELCFTIPSQFSNEVRKIEENTGLKITKIGKITHKSGFVWYHKGEKVINMLENGFKHFK